jgi:hypothetical protein
MSDYYSMPEETPHITPNTSKKQTSGWLVLTGILTMIVVLIAGLATYFLFMMNVQMKDTANSLATLEKQYAKAGGWEYKVISLNAKELDLYVNDEINPAQVDVSQSLLNQYGLEGWELVDIVTQYETVHPNFGNDEYVYGIQPNVRPNSADLVFKRPAGSF